jgi:hypothetical protein
MPQPYSGDELTPTDLETYTQGRLLASDPNTQLALDAALDEVRGYCKWHVTPVATEANMGFDGPGQWGGYAVGIGGLYYASGGYMTGVLRRARVGAEILFLPTKRLLNVESIVEDGNTLTPLTDYVWSQDTGAVQKTNGTPWTANWASGNGATQGLQVTFTHGYTAEQARDWRRIVLACADRMTMVRGLIGPFTSSMGPYRVNAFFGESRAGTLPLTASWLDDLTGQLNTERYVRVDV